MRKAIIIILLTLAVLTACNRGYEATDEATVTEETPIDEQIEIIRDLGGREIRIAAAWPYLPFATRGIAPNPATSRNYVLDRALYEQIQLSSMQYNIILTALHIDHNNIMPTLETSVAAGAPFADMVLLAEEMVLPAITGNLIYAMEEFTTQSDFFGTEGFPRASSEFMGVHWTIAPHAMEFNGMFLGVNLDIVRSIREENPVSLYENGYWTYQSFMEIMQAAVDAGYYGISGVPSDIISNLVAANNGIFVNPDFTVAYNNPHTLAAFETARNIFAGDFWLPNQGYHNFHGNLLAFMDGQSLFFPLSVWVVREVDIPFPFTVVPFPEGNMGDGSYSFMKGFDMGLAIPRGTPNPADVLTVFESISILAEERDRVYIAGSFRTERDATRAMGILREQGKFDISMSIPQFHWMYGIMAQEFSSGSWNTRTTVDRLLRPQQEVLDGALGLWYTIARN